MDIYMDQWMDQNIMDKNVGNESKNLMDGSMFEYGQIWSIYCALCNLIFLF